MELSERDKCSSDQKSTEHHGSSGLWSSPMAEAAFPAMNMPSCRTHPNASHLASGSAFVSRAFSPFSTIDVDMVDQDKSTLQGLAAKKKKKNSSEIQELEDERRRGEAAMAADSKESVDTTQQTEAAKEDYIHVRARRGQATNSHSLAERVRREKISQRMKFLQELVPGCSKVTGKAVMLDEIINYVQSLQRQVEFLSMKLATVNPRMDFSIEALLSKDQFLQSQSGPSSSAIGFSPDIVHVKVDPSRRGLVRSGLSASLSTANAQFNSVPNAWEEQLQSAMQMACFSNNTHLPRTQ